MILSPLTCTIPPAPSINRPPSRRCSAKTRAQCSGDSEGCSK